MSERHKGIKRWFRFGHQRSQLEAADKTEEEIAIAMGHQRMPKQDLVDSERDD